MKIYFLTFVILLAVLLSGLFTLKQPVKKSDSDLLHEAYIWQRSWDDSVNDAIDRNAHEFEGLVALVAEVSLAYERMHVTRIPIDYGKLLSSRKPIGIALRIGPYFGPFSRHDEISSGLSVLAASLVEEAKRESLHIRELQIDFDCPESKLDGYLIWIEAIKSRVSPVPVTITALPSWINKHEFKILTDISDGFILQVHSLKPPKYKNDGFEICDPDEANAWIEQASKIGKPFRVSLPTYGYILAYDKNSKFIGLSAEGLNLSQPDGGKLLRIDSDPAEMAGLVKSLTDKRPEELKGVIWYRLPIKRDRLNWNQHTLEAVMNGRTPQSILRPEVHHTSPGLVDIDIFNEGEGPSLSDIEIAVSWEGARLIGADGLNGFKLKKRESTRVSLLSINLKDFRRIEPGERWSVGWLRFDQETEVEVNVQQRNP